MYSTPVKRLSYLVLRKDDLPLGNRIVCPTVKVGFLSFRSVHELLEEVLVGVEVHATSMRRVLGIKQVVSIVMFLWDTSG